MISYEVALRAVEILIQMGYRAEVDSNFEIEYKNHVAIGSTAPATTVGYAIALSLIEQNPRVGTIPSRAKDHLPSDSEITGGKSAIYW